MTYHNTMLSNLYLFEVCSLPTLKPKSGPVSERLELFVCCVVSVCEGLLGNSLFRALH